MGSTTDKASGLANEAIGEAKQGIGNVVGSDKLEAEGAAQELKGDAQKAVGNAKAAIKDVADKTADARQQKSLTSKFHTTNGSVRSRDGPYRSYPSSRARTFLS